MECSPTGLRKPFTTAAASHRPTGLRKSFTTAADGKTANADRF